MNFKYKYLSIITLLILFACNTKSENKRIPIYIEPFYNSQPFKINVEKYNEELKSEDKDAIIKLSNEIKSNKDNIELMTMFVLATRLYDLGLKDEASYWYYTAGLRRNVFKETLIADASSGEYKMALDAYYKLLGEYINGYSFGDLDKTIKITNQIIEESQNLKSFSRLYPNYQFDDTKLDEAIENSINDRKELISYIEENREEIKKARKENGIENKY